MGQVEAIRGKLVVNLDRRLLQGNDGPPSCNLFLERHHLLFPSGSRVPVVDAESPMHNRTGSNVFTETLLVRICSRFPF